MNLYNKRKYAAFIDYSILVIVIGILSVIIPLSVLKRFPILEVGLVIGMIAQDFFGASIGKRIQGLTVVTEDGGKPTKRQLILRNLPKLLLYPEIYKMKKGEIRYGDQLAKTKVIQKCPNNKN